MPGGCLTQWHARTNLCTGGPAGMISGFSTDGVCPSGENPLLTPEMLHVWQVPVPGGPLTMDPTDQQVVEAAVMAQQAGQAPVTPGAQAPLSRVRFPGPRHEFRVEVTFVTSSDVPRAPDWGNGGGFAARRQLVGGWRSPRTRDGRDGNDHVGRGSVGLCAAGLVGWYAVWRPQLASSLQRAPVRTDPSPRVGPRERIGQRHRVEAELPVRAGALTPPTPRPRHGDEKPVCAIGGTFAPIGRLSASAQLMRVTCNLRRAQARREER